MTPLLLAACAIEPMQPTRLRFRPLDAPAAASIVFADDTWVQGDVGTLGGEVRGDVYVRERPVTRANDQSDELLVGPGFRDLLFPPEGPFEGQGTVDVTNGTPDPIRLWAGGRDGFTNRAEALEPGATATLPVDLGRSVLAESLDGTCLVLAKVTSATSSLTVVTP